MNRKFNSRQARFVLTNAIVVFAVAFSLFAVQPIQARPNTEGETMRYVSMLGLDDSNDCAVPETPCLTINHAISQSMDGDTIKVAVGVYTAASGNEVALINKSITLSGGWDEAFVTQEGMSTIDGQGVRKGISVNTALLSAVDHFTISHGFNSYDDSASLLNDSGALTLNNIIINDGDGNGKGIANYDGSITINNSVIHNMEQGIYNDSQGAIIINNSTISGNRVGISNMSLATIAINNSTISGNEVGIDSFYADITLQNSIIAGNYIEGNCKDALISQGHNLIGDTAGCVITPAAGDQFNVDPKLAPLWDNGGATFTHALYSNSPAINAGNPDTCLPTDQRGVTRPAGITCDIGAYEGHVAGVTSVHALNLNPINASSVSFEIYFSEPVTGVNLTEPFSDFALTTNKVTDAAVTAVSGSGDTYTVTVATGSWGRNGTIRLDVVDDDSILNASNTPLGGTGTGNGDFTDGEVYSLLVTKVNSSTRLSANPTGVKNVNFKVTFSRSVTGVNLSPPFDDFSLTTTNLPGAAIIAVSGSGNIYTVTVNAGTGDGNGTLRLNVVDDDSILDASSNPLGGVGAGNGDFTSGQVYSIVRIPTPKSPTGVILDTTPTFKWTKINGATEYRFQLKKGTNTIYTKTFSASECGATVCSSTPTTVLGFNNNYKWRVQAKINGEWKTYSPYKTFKLFPAKPGLWKNQWNELYVTNTTPKVDDFAIYAYIYGCGTYKITYFPAVPIKNKRFAFTGSFYANGTFNTPTTVQGLLGLNYYHIPGCGYISGGPFSWSASWYNKNQPPAMSGEGGTTPFPSIPELETPFDLFEIEPEK